MKILCAGGSGFLGSHFIRMLLKNNPQALVVNLDALTHTGNPENLADIKTNRYVFVQGDVTDKKMIESLFSSYSIDTVVNFADEQGGPLLDPETMVKTNVLGAFTLLEAARKYWLVEKRQGDIKTRFHQVSCAEVYGGLSSTESTAFTETSRYDPSGPHAATKAAADQMTIAYARTYGLHATVSVSSLNFGPYQNPDAFIPKMILSGLVSERITLEGDWEESRDWIYVEDHVHAILEILRKGKPGQSYNVASGNMRTRAEVADTVRDEINKARKRFLPPVETQGHKIAFDKLSSLNYAKLYKETGWLPSHTFIGALRHTVDWYLSQKEWLENIAKRKEYADWIVAQYGANPT